MTTQQITPYELLGGEQAVRDLVDRFYFYMDSLPEATDVRKMHAENLTEARQKLFKFFSGWLGGPDLFVNEYGHPRLRRRHFPFAIGQLERDQWITCMTKTLDEIEMPDTLRLNLNQSLQELATHMINKNE